MESSLILALTTNFPRYLYRIPFTSSFEQDPEADDLIIINDAATAANLLSIVGCLFNFITTIVLSTYKLTLGKMVIALSLMDFMSSLVSILTNIQTESDFYCKVQGFFWFFGTGGSLAWTTCFAHGLYISTRYNNLELLDKNFKIYIVYTTFSAVLLGIAGFFLDFFVMETQLMTCYHRTVRGDVDWPALILMIIPTVITVLCCGCCYIAAMKNLRQARGKIHLELLLYPFLLILCQFPGLAVMLALQINENFPIPLWLFVLTNFLINAQGILNAIAYGLSSRIIQGYKRRCCRRKTIEVEYEDEDDELEYSEEETHDHGIKRVLTGTHTI